MSKHREPKTGTNPRHGNNTLITKVLETQTMANQGKRAPHPGQRCGDCTGFHFCVQVKGVREATSYCQWGENRFSNGRGP